MHLQYPNALAMRSGTRFVPSTPKTSMRQNHKIQKAYDLARARFAELGVDTEKALQKLSRLSVSIHCWQGDDVGGFENAGQELGGGLAVTGNYPGKARTAQELRADFEKVLS